MKFVHQGMCIFSIYDKKPNVYVCCLFKELNELVYVAHMFKLNLVKLLIFKKSAFVCNFGTLCFTENFDLKQIARLVLRSA